MAQSARSRPSHANAKLRNTGLGPAIAGRGAIGSDTITQYFSPRKISYLNRMRTGGVVALKKEIATMHNLIASAGLALTVSLAGMAFTSAPASAQDIQLQLGQDGPRLRLRDNCDPNREDCSERGDRSYRRDDNNYGRREERGCTPDRALYKAERMGIRRARIDDVGRRTIDVAGRSRNGNRVIVTFDRRDRRCGVVG